VRMVKQEKQSLKSECHTDKRSVELISGNLLEDNILRDRVDRIPSSHSGGLGFKFWSEDHLS
jgi:hypothetical protein